MGHEDLSNLIERNGQMGIDQTYISWNQRSVEDHQLQRHKHFLSYWVLLLCFQVLKQRCLFALTRPLVAKCRPRARIPSIARPLWATSSVPCLVGGLEHVWFSIRLRWYTVYKHFIICFFIFSVGSKPPVFGVFKRSFQPWIKILWVFQTFLATASGFLQGMTPPRCLVSWEKALVLHQARQGLRRILSSSSGCRCGHGCFGWESLRWRTWMEKSFWHIRHVKIIFYHNIH